MKYLLLILVLLSGCAGMDDYYYEDEYYIPAASGCANVAPMVQSAPVPGFTQPPQVQPAGYQTKEPPR
jgi:hypothetical protein